MSSSVNNNENIVQLSPEKIKYAPIEQAIDDIRNGKFVIVADDEGRENEGDLICSAEKITPAMMNFMMLHARGMVCVAMLPERANQLRLSQMVDENTDPNQTAFTVSVDAGYEFGVSTGVSAADRAITVQRLASPNATALDFRRPGHMFPVQAKKGGVFRRIGHTEAAIDLTRLAGHSPMGVICEILNEDGSMARRDDLAIFAKKHGLSFVTISQLIQYRLQNEKSVIRRVAKEIETRFGTFTAIGYKDNLDGAEHLALVKGPIEKLSETAPYVRIQHENLITDMLGKSHDEMPYEMETAMQFMQQQESGVVVYLRHSDDGLFGSLQAYKKPDAEAQTAYDANKSDLRDYGVGAQILFDLGVTQFRMLSKSSKKIVALRGYGLEVIETVALGNNNFDYSLPPKVQLPTNVETTAPASTSTGEFVSPVTVSDEVLTPAPQNQNTQEKPQQPLAATPQTTEAAKANTPDLKAEPRANTMKMGGQVMNGQALFEG